MQVKQGEKLIKVSNGMFHYEWFTLKSCPPDDKKKVNIRTSESVSDSNETDDKVSLEAEFDFKAPEVPGEERNNLKQHGKDNELIVVFFHGAGQSTLSWRPLFTSLSNSSKSLYPVTLLAFDARGHGKTKTENETDLSIATLTNDALNLIQAVCTEGSSILLVGHSMGGAVATHVATKLATIKLQFKLRGLMLIDIVEGSALDSLADSMAMVRSRPRSFDSTKSAIDWSFKQKMIRNRNSANVTVAGQLVRRDDGTYTWRTDLVSTFSHWEGWFKGLSEAFLSLPISGKLLLIGGWNRLDTALTRGQMQGKFKLVMAPQGMGGHFIHEDSPEYVAEIVSNFLLRNAPKSLEEQKSGKCGFSAQEILALNSKSRR